MTKEELKSNMIEAWMTSDSVQACIEVAEEHADQQTAELKVKLSQAEADKRELLEALICAKDIIVNLAPFGLTEEVLFNNAEKGGNFYKIVTAINKAQCSIKQ